MSRTMTDATESAPPSVFICYRREDTAAHAGRLYDAMVARFGERHVFMDVDIAPGVNFVERITEMVSGCLVLIVVMGPRWATLEDGNGNQRIADPDDFVRLEVETALRRDEVTPIPVLVSGARMPHRNDLPAELQPLTYRNALELSDMRWGYDVGRLNSALDVLLADTIESETASAAAKQAAPAPAATPEPATETVAPTVAPPPARPEPKPEAPPKPRPKAPAEPEAPPRPEPVAAPASAAGGSLVLEGTLVAAGVAFAARMIAEAIPAGSSDVTNAVNVIARRGATWALVAAALLIWLAIRTGREDLGRLTARGLLAGAVAGVIGGVIWAAPVFLPNPDLAFTGGTADWVQVGSLAVTGGLLGLLLGETWRPARDAVGLACGAAAGALVQIAAIGLGWGPARPAEIALYFAISAAAIAALTLATLSRPRP